MIKYLKCLKKHLKQTPVFLLVISSLGWVNSYQLLNSCELFKESIPIDLRWGHITVNMPYILYTPKKILSPLHPTDTCIPIISRLYPRFFPSLSPLIISQLYAHYRYIPNISLLYPHHTATIYIPIVSP